MAEDVQEILVDAAGRWGRGSTSVTVPKRLDSVGLMDATTAVPGLRTISVIVPHARVLNLAQSMVTESYAFVGSADAEMKLTDSVTGTLLPKPSTSGIGGMGIKRAASFQWATRRTR